MNGKAYLISLVTTGVVGYAFTRNSVVAWEMAVMCACAQVIVHAVLKKKRKKRT